MIPNVLKQPFNRFLYVMPVILFPVLWLAIWGSFFHSVNTAYLDPALSVVQTENVSVIVTGESSKDAAHKQPK